MTASSPASMGGPLSEAEEAAARIRAYLDADTGSESFGRLMPYELPDGAPRDLSRADLVAILNGFGVLEGQLATAQAELEQQRYYGEQLQMSIESCSGNHDDALGLDGGDPDER